MIQNLLEDKHNKVFVHCSSGISRGPSAVLTHLCLYKKVNCWEDIDQSAVLIQQHHQEAFPNIKAVTRVVNNNLEFQERQIDRETQEEIDRILLRMEQAEKHRLDEERRFSEDEVAYKQHKIIRKEYYDKQAHELKVKKQNNDDDIHKRTNWVKSETNRIQILEREYQDDLYREQ
jgi:hypothetical protein